MNGIPQKIKPEPYPSRMEDNCLTTVVCEVKFKDNPAFKKIIRIRARLRNDEINEFVKRHPDTCDWVKQDCVVTVIRMNYWNLHYIVETDIVIS